MKKHLHSTLPILILTALICACAPAAAKIDKGPYLQNVKPSEITISWESVKPLPSRITYAPQASSGAYLSVEPALQPFNEITLTDLLPGTKYRYSVWQNGAVKARGTFLTAPAGPAPFRFAAYGDCRTGHIFHTAVLAGMKKYDPAFVVNSGDLVTDGTKQEDWNDFWRVVSPFAEDVPYFPSLGNHEKNSPNYYKYFSLPMNGDNERYYSFTYGKVFFAALDSAAPDFMLGQKKWLVEQLKAAADYDFKVVFFHNPFYSSSKREPNVHFRKTYQPVFKKYGVTLVINGHDHFYERSEDENGTMYVITGGGGAPLYGFEREIPESKVRKSLYHFVIFDVDGKKMDARTIDIDGNEIDAFTLAAP